MPTNYFLQNTNNETTCDAGSSPGPDRDLSKTQGSATTITVDVSSITSFQEVCTFDLDVSGDSPSTGSHTVNVSLNSVSKAEVRWRVQCIDDSGCGVDGSSSYSTTYTTAGAKSDSLSLTWAGTSERLRLSVEAREEPSSHGSRQFILDVQHASSYIAAPWTITSQTGKITAVDADITYTEKTAKITATDADLTYTEKTAKITATDADLTYTEKTGKITAVDADITYSEIVQTGKITAVDADLTYTEKTAKITAVDADITHTIEPRATITAVDADLTYTEKTAKITAVDADITYTEAAGSTAKITAVDADITYSETTARITAADVDLTHTEKTAKITAADAEIEYGPDPSGHIVAVDVDLTHTEKTAKITALDADLTYSETIPKAVTPDFVSAAADRTARQTIGFSIVAPGSSGLRALYAGTAVMSRAAIGTPTIYKPYLLAAGDLVQDGSPGVESAKTVVTFLLSNKIVNDVSGGGVEEITQKVQDTWWIGATCNASVFVEHTDGSWQEQLVFQGRIVETEINADAVIVRAAHIADETTQIPAVQVMPDSMNYDTSEGKRPDGFVGAVSPVFYGRFSTEALDSAYIVTTRPPTAWQSAMGELHAPATGTRIPVIPLVPLADLFNWKDGATSLTAAKFALFGCGDLDEGSPAGIDKSISLRRTDSGGPANPERSVYIPHDPASPSNDRLHFVRLFTFNRDTDQLMPFVKDQSDDMDTLAWTFAEKPWASAGDWHYENGKPTSQTGRNSDAQSFYIQRLDPDWTGNPPEYWMGTCQSLALPAERLGQIGGFTGGIEFETISPGQQALNCLDEDLASSARIIGGNPGGRICVQMPAVGPQLGEIMAIRLCFVADGPSRDIRVAFRFHPSQLSAVLANWNTTNPTSNQARLDPLSTSPETGAWGAVNIWRRQSQGFGHGIPQWVFTELDGDPAFAYAGEAVFWTADLFDAYLHRVWYDIVFRPSSLRRFVQRLPNTEGVTRAEGGYVVDGTKDLGGKTRRRRYGTTPVHYPYTGNVPDPEEKALGPLQVFATGRGTLDAQDDSARWTFSHGDSDTVIENPISIAAHALDKFAGQYGNIETGANQFGSFRDAYEYLENKAGAATFNEGAWAISVVQPTAIAIQKFLDRLADHGKCFFQRQIADTGGVKWRCFVDSDQPGTDFPERIWRDGTAVSVSANYMDKESLRVPMTGRDSIRNRFVVRYGFDEARRQYSYELVLNRNGCDLTVGASEYATALGESEDRYGATILGLSPYVSEEVIELPWCWRRRVAEEIARWHADIKRNSRVALSFTGSVYFADMQVGNVVKLDDDIEEIVGHYPGLSSLNWSDRDWNCIERTIRYDGSQVLVDVTLVEAYQEVTVLP